MTSELFKITTSTPEETESAGERTASLADSLGVDFIALFGDLGAGKTAFTRGIAEVLTPGALVSSPTYAIVNEYEPDYTPEAPGSFGKNKRRPLFHFDMYRIEDEDSLDSIGFYDYLEREGFIVTEWSENIVDFLPERYIKVELVKLSDDRREITAELIEL